MLVVKVIIIYCTGIFKHICVQIQYIRSLNKKELLVNKNTNCFFIKNLFLYTLIILGLSTNKVVFINWSVNYPMGFFLVIM